MRDREQSAQQLIASWNDTTLDVHVHDVHVDEHDERMNSEHKERITRIRTANQCIADAKLQPPIKSLVGNLWHTGEIAFLVGDTGIGKSILAVWFAHLIASSLKKFIGLSCQATVKVLYYDLELSDRQFENRFSGFSFSDDLFRVDINPKCIEAQLNLEQIEKDLDDTGATVIIIDNITALNMKNTADPEAAMTIMRSLKKLQIEKGVSILVLAHVPKIPVGISLNINHLAGSKHLSNFADSVFFIARSCQESSYRYIKQVKARNSELPTDVIVCDLQKKKDYLTFDFVSYDEEQNHLVVEQAKSEEKEAEKQQVWDLGEQGRSQRQIADLTGFSLGKVNRLLKLKSDSVHVHPKREHMNASTSLEDLMRIANNVLGEYSSRKKPKIIWAIKQLLDIDELKATDIFLAVLQNGFIELVGETDEYTLK